MPDSEIRHKLSGLALRGALTPNEKARSKRDANVSIKRVRAFIREINAVRWISGTTSRCPFWGFLGTVDPE